MTQKRDFDFDVRMVRAAQENAAQKRLVAMDISEQMKIKTERRAA